MNSAASNLLYSSKLNNVSAHPKFQKIMSSDRLSKLIKTHLKLIKPFTIDKLHDFKILIECSFLLIQKGQYYLAKNYPNMKLDKVLQFLDENIEIRNEIEILCHHRDCFSYYIASWTNSADLFLHKEFPKLISHMHIENIKSFYYSSIPFESKKKFVSKNKREFNSSFFEYHSIIQEDSEF